MLLLEWGYTRGVETPIAPGVVDVLDAGGVVEGHGVVWRRPRRVRRVRTQSLVPNELAFRRGHASERHLKVVEPPSL